MTVLEFLQSGDPSVRLTRIHLLGQAEPCTEEGWIGELLRRFDPETGTWGNGIYSPKWISTFYTMRDLAALEIDPLHPVYQAGLETLVSHMWTAPARREDDICVVAMLASLLLYGQSRYSVLDEMFQYLVENQQPDGGWNCSSTHHSTLKSSVHTTLTVLEAYADAEKTERAWHPLKGSQAQEGREYLLRKKLMRRETDGQLIFPSITGFHFPVRWKYDVLRALCYFAGQRYPFDPRMEEALDLLEKKIRRGWLPRGTAHPGLIHFAFETGRAGRMNTFRGLLVLKHYDPDLYDQIIQMETEF